MTVNELIARLQEYPGAAVVVTLDTDVLNYGAEHETSAFEVCEVPYFTNKPLFERWAAAEVGCLAEQPEIPADGMVVIR